MTPVALEAAGMMDRAGNWTGKYGIHSPAEFLADPEAQGKRSVTGACRWSSLRAMIGHGSDNDGSVHYRLGGH